MIRVELPYHLRLLAGVDGREVALEPLRPTVEGLLDELERKYPMLRGTVRDQVTGQRRPFLRFFACGEDLTQAGLDAALPGAVVSGVEVLVILGAVAGGLVT